jgi:hypothetical protein
MAWYGERDIPVELNEPHHWGMRDAPDVVFVVSAYLSAYNASAFGVKDYICQLMFNSPPGHSDAMDLAKMLAVIDLISPLESRLLSFTTPSYLGARLRTSMQRTPRNDMEHNFRIWLQTRTGLLSYPLDRSAARAHLAASIYLQMSLHPHIVHVVGHTEAHHAATAEDVIEACKLANRTIDNALGGAPDMTHDPAIQARRVELVAEAQVTLEKIHNLAGADVPDPLIDPITLAKVVQTGILDAPHLRNNPFALGQVHTRIIDGKCLAVDVNGKPLSESERLLEL